MFQASKNENEILEPWMRSLHESSKENKKKKKIKSPLPKLWWKKPQEYLYEAWKMKKNDFLSLLVNSCKWGRKGSQICI